jgi:5-methylcytosine-specific restriction endonuclease McrA
MAISKATRLQVYNKHNGRCAYCGKTIKLKDMQVDHIVPVRAHPYYKQAVDINDIKNLNPSCRRCNHYKRADSLEMFRLMMKTLHERIRANYICKVAEDYRIIKIEPWDGKFYFEREDDK